MLLVHTKINFHGVQTTAKILYFETSLKKMKAKKQNAKSMTNYLKLITEQLASTMF